MAKSENYSEFKRISDYSSALFLPDNLGRLVRFENVKFASQAECGKPVIYLYPEKTETVSLKVRDVAFSLTKHYTVIMVDKSQLNQMAN